MTEGERLHYYAFSFSGYLRDNPLQNCFASVYIGYNNKNITLAKLSGAKEGAGVVEDSVLISASYMGYMTPEEIKG